MGFTLGMFDKHPASTLRKGNANSNGVILVKPGERKVLDIDLQTTNTLIGDISIQGVSNVDTTVRIYYSNWNGKLSADYGFIGLDPDGIQNDSEEKALWFKHTKDFVLSSQVPKHEQITLPISRFVKLVIDNTSSQEMAICLHFLCV